MIQHASLYDSDECFGWCDGEHIWVSSGKMHYLNIIGTLLHESLHGTVLVPGRDELSEDEEHDAMELLGDYYARGGA